MRCIVKAMCLGVVCIVLMSFCMVSAATVTKTDAINFHAERSIFQSAKIMNPWTDNQILRVELVDGTVLYRDLNTDEVWKEYQDNGVTKQSPDLSKAELTLVLAFDLDTGWFPETGYLQMRYIFTIGKDLISADLNGDAKLRYDDEDVTAGTNLDAQLGWGGQLGGCAFTFSGVVEVSGQGRYYRWTWDYSPLYSVMDWDPLGVIYFSPFLLNRFAACNDIIAPADSFFFPTWNYNPNIIYFGAGFKMFAGASLGGKSICGDIAGNSSCIGIDDEWTNTTISISDVSCETDVDMTSTYNSTCAVNWSVQIRPFGRYQYFIGYIDLPTDPVEFTLIDATLPVDFNEPLAHFSVEGLPPVAPDRPTLSATEVCTNTEFQVSWPAVPKTTSYEIKENDGTWKDIGNLTAITYTKHEGGHYAYFVRGINLCGPGSASEGRTIFIKTPPPEPDSVCCLKASCAINEQFELYWNKVDDASTYRLYENGQQCYSGNDTCRTITHADTGSYCYTLSACNECGEGDTCKSFSMCVEEKTHVASVESPHLPSTFVLSQNYPNPFNPDTRIDFAIPRRSTVTLDIYNVLGNRVRRLINESLSPGYKTVTWDGRDDNGLRVSSGVYLYRITAGNYTECRKMILVK